MKTRQLEKSTMLHLGQTKILRSRARFRVVACGRRFGKTEFGKVSVISKARHGKRCWWLSPTYRMANQVWRDLKRISVRLDNAIVSQTDMRIDFPGGGMIAIRSTHAPDNLRGEGLDFVVLDEAAFMSPDVWPEIVQPMLLERKGHA